MARRPALRESSPGSRRPGRRPCPAGPRRSPEPVGIRGDGADGVQVGPTGEDRQATEERLLRGREQVVRPGDGVAQRLLPTGSQRAGRDDVEGLVEPRQQRARAEQPRIRAAASSIASGSPSRRRQIATTSASVVRRRAEVGADAARPLDEQLHRTGSFRVRESRALGQSAAAAPDAGAPPARTGLGARWPGTASLRSSGQQLGHHVVGPRQLFEVVQDEQCATVRHMGEEARRCARVSAARPAPRRSTSTSRRWS